MLKGTKENPWSQAEVVENALYGKEAIKAVEKKEKVKLTAAQKRVVELEGYVPGYYLDANDTVAYGVGQTGDYVNLDFVASYEHHQEKAEDIFGPLVDYPEDLATEFVQLVYRGDAEKRHNWVQQVKRGEFAKAADSLLVHREYLDLKKEGKDNSITQRLEAASKTLEKYEGGF